MATEPEQAEESLEDETTRPKGRPLMFESVKDLDAAIDQYLGDCAPHIVNTKVRRTKVDGAGYWADDEIISEQKPVTVSGAALMLGTSRRTLLGYKARKDFLPSIERLLSACEAYTEAQLYGPGANGAKFSLVNNFKGRHQDWADKQEVDHTTKGDKINPMAGLTVDELRRLAQEPHGDGEHSQS